MRLQHEMFENDTCLFVLITTITIIATITRTITEHTTATAITQLSTPSSSPADTVLAWTAVVVGAAVVVLFGFPGSTTVEAATVFRKSTGTLGYVI